MLQPDTAQKIDRGLEDLRLAQLVGLEDPPPLSHARIAHWCGVSEPTIRRLESITLAKARRALLETSPSRTIARLAERLEPDNNQPELKLTTAK